MRLGKHVTVAHCGYSYDCHPQGIVILIEMVRRVLTYWGFENLYLVGIYHNASDNRSYNTQVGVLTHQSFNSVHLLGLAAIHLADSL